MVVETLVLLPAARRIELRASAAGRRLLPRGVSPNALYPQRTSHTHRAHRVHVIRICMNMYAYTYVTFTYTYTRELTHTRTLTYITRDWQVARGRRALSGCAPDAHKLLDAVADVSSALPRFAPLV